MEKLFFIISSTMPSFGGEAPTAKTTIFLSVSLGKAFLMSFIPFMPTAWRLPPKIIVEYSESFLVSVFLASNRSASNSWAIHSAYFFVKPDVDW